MKRIFCSICYWLCHVSVDFLQFTAVLVSSKFEHYRQQYFLSKSATSKFYKLCKVVIPDDIPWTDQAFLPYLWFVESPYSNDFPNKITINRNGPQKSRTHLVFGTVIKSTKCMGKNEVLCKCRSNLIGTWNFGVSLNSTNLEHLLYSKILLQLHNQNFKILKFRSQLWWKSIKKMDKKYILKLWVRK